MEKPDVTDPTVDDETPQTTSTDLIHYALLRVFASETEPQQQPGQKKQQLISYCDHGSYFKDRVPLEQRIRGELFRPPIVIDGQPRNRVVVNSPLPIPAAGQFVVFRVRQRNKDGSKHLGPHCSCLRLMHACKLLTTGVPQSSMPN